jgi:hypothetical protein
MVTVNARLGSNQHRNIVVLLTLAGLAGESLGRKPLNRPPAKVVGTVKGASATVRRKTPSSANPEAVSD